MAELAVLPRTQALAQLSREDSDFDGLNEESIYKGPLMYRFLYELKFRNVWFTEDGVYGKLNWVVAFGQPGGGCFCGAKISGLNTWLAFRTFVCVYCTFVFLYSITATSNITEQPSFAHGLWFTLLTNWQTTVIMMYSVSALTSCALIRASQPEILALDLDASNVRVKPMPMPWHCQLTWVLHSVAVTMSIFVFLAYWGYVQSLPGFHVSDDPSYLLDHLSTFVLVVVDFMLSPMPWALMHALWSVLYASCYVLFSVAFTYSGLHNAYDGGPYTYPVLDWANNPGVAVGFSLPAVLLGAPLISLVVWTVFSGPRLMPGSGVPWIDTDGRGGHRRTSWFFANGTLRPLFNCWEKVPQRRRTVREMLSGARSVEPSSAAIAAVKQPVAAHMDQP